MVINAELYYQMNNGIDRLLVDAYIAKDNFEDIEQQLRKLEWAHIEMGVVSATKSTIQLSRRLIL